MALTKITTNIIEDDAITADKIAAGAIDSTHVTGLSTSDISEGTNLYFTNARVGSYLTTNSYATESYVTTAVSNLVDAAPAALDTLNELAAALGDDANFSTTVTNSIATKVSKSGDTMTGNLDVTGTVTADGVETDSFDSSSTNLEIKTSARIRGVNGGDFQGSSGVANDASGPTYTFRGDPDTGFFWGGANTIGITTSGSQRVNIASNGDISFYEDTGTTPKFFWDASTERLGLGTTSPAEALHVYHPTDNVNVIIESGDANAYLSFKDSTTLAANGVYIGVTGGDNFGVYTGGNTARMYIDNTGKVGIGTSNPTTRLELSGVKDTSELRLSSTTNDASWVNGEYFGKLSFYSADSSGAGAGVKGAIVTAQSGSSGATPYMTFNVASTSANDVERMRIDANGNVGLGNGAYIGTLSSTHSLSIQGGAGAPGGKITLYGGTGSNRIDFLIDASEVARIDSGGNFAIANGNQTASTVSSRIMFGNKGYFTESSTGRAEIVGVSEGALWYSGTALAFLTNPGPDVTARGPDERMRITSAGLVGIGTTSPSSRLTVNGTSSVTAVAGSKDIESKRWVSKFTSGSANTVATVSMESGDGASQLAGFVFTFIYRTSYGFNSGGGGHGVLMISGRVSNTGTWTFDTSDSTLVGDGPDPTVSGGDNGFGTAVITITTPASTHAFGELNLIAWDCTITSPQG